MFWRKAVDKKVKRAAAMFSNSGKVFVNFPGFIIILLHNKRLKERNSLGYEKEYN